MTTRADVLSALPELRWRDLDAVPVEDASYDFGHEQAERKYPFIDGAGHQHTGRTPVQFSCKLLFLNTLGNDRLYPHVWEEWRSALFDGAAGALVHPELGEVNARVLHGSVRINAGQRAGVTVEVSFVESLNDPSRPIADFPVLSVGLSEAAKAAQKAASAVKINYPKVEDPPETDIFSAVASVEGQIRSAATALGGKVNQVIGAVRSMADRAAALASIPGDLTAASPWAAQYNLGLVEEMLVDLANKPSARPTGSETLTGPTSLDAFARKVGNTVAEIIELNPGALGRPTVGTGKTLYFYVQT